MIKYLHKTDNPFFSILICSLSNQKREVLLNRLFKKLKIQLNNDIEIIVNIDNGEKSIGKKRNELLDATHKSSEFIAYIDDDDLISNDYISKILQALNDCPDAVGLMGVMTTDGRNPKTLIHSLQYDHWYENGGIYYRTPNHLNPIRKEYAEEIRFPEISMGEDHDYSNRLYQLIKGKKEIFIDSPIYFYDYRTTK